MDDSHLQEILNLLAEYLPDKRILAFGSRVRHTAKPHSDLDLAILDDKPTGLSRLGLIRDAFEAYASAARKTFSTNTRTSAGSNCAPAFFCNSRMASSLRKASR